MLKVLLGAMQVIVCWASSGDERGEDVVAVAAEDEVVVDLVGDDEQVALDGDAAEGLELLRGPRPGRPDCGGCRG